MLIAVHALKSNLSRILAPAQAGEVIDFVFIRHTRECGYPVLQRVTGFPHSRE
jgi:hypothetical protein